MTILNNDKVQVAKCYFFSDINTQDFKVYISNLNSTYTKLSCQPWIHNQTSGNILQILLCQMIMWTFHIMIPLKQLLINSNIMIASSNNVFLEMPLIMLGYFSSFPYGGGVHMFTHNYTSLQENDDMQGYICDTWECIRQIWKYDHVHVNLFKDQTYPTGRCLLGTVWRHDVCWLVVRDQPIIPQFFYCRQILRTASHRNTTCLSIARLLQDQLPIDRCSRGVVAMPVYSKKHFLSNKKRALI